MLILITIINQPAFVTLPPIQQSGDTDDPAAATLKEEILSQTTGRDITMCETEMCVVL